MTDKKCPRCGTEGCIKLALQLAKQKTSVGEMCQADIACSLRAGLEQRKRSIEIEKLLAEYFARFLTRVRPNDD